MWPQPEVTGVTRLELAISTALLILFIAGVRYGLNYVNAEFGLGSLAVVCIGGLALVLIASYVVERRRGNLPDWLRPRDQCRQRPD